VDYQIKYKHSQRSFSLSDSVVKVVFAVFIAIIVLLLVILLIKYVSKGKKKRPKPVPQSEEITAWSGLYRFSKAEIENAINHSKVRKSLGRGSAGQVYKGVLPSGQVVAIKHIHNSSSCDSFQREVEGLSRVRHPNLVCLFGFCIEGGERYLVYEYCAAGNLSQNLRSNSPLISKQFQYCFV
jgi:serine/threonine protein kinase